MLVSRKPAPGRAIHIVHGAIILAAILLLLPGLLAFPGAAGPAHAARAAITLPNATLIRDTGNGRVYVVWNNQRHWINSPDTFQALGYDYSQVVSLDTTTVGSISDGTVLSLNTVAGGLVWPLAPINADPVHLGLDAPTANPGHTIRVNGSGFSPYEAVELNAPDNENLTVNADVHGAFSIDVPILSSVTVGLHHIYAQGQQSGLFGVQVFQVRAPAAAPTIAAAPDPVVIGADLSVVGSGFQPGESIEIFYAAGASTSVVIAGSNGTFGPVTVSVPVAAGAGTHTLRAYGAGSYGFTTIEVTVLNVVPSPTSTATGTPTPTSMPTATSTATSTATPVLTPAISASPSTVSAGAQTVIGGSGFRPGETVFVRFNGIVQGSAVAGLAGTFGGVLLTVPGGSSPGGYVVTATGATSNAAAGTLIAVTAAQPTVVPHIAISPSLAPPGARILIAGTGYTPGETVLVSFDAGVVASLVADSAGSFTNGTFVVPSNVQPGGHGVLALGTTSQQAASTAITVTAPPPVPVVRLAVTPATVAPGMQIHITGSGFVAYETLLVRIDGNPVQQAQADGSGAFQTAIRVQAGLGRHTINVLGVSSRRASGAALLVVQPVHSTVRLGQRLVHRGSTVTVDGSDFAPGEIVLIQLNGLLVQAARVNTSGNFGAHFGVPATTRYGTAQVIALGARSGRSARASLRIEPVPPAGIHIRLSTSVGHRGNTVRVFGGGFWGEETVLIFFRGNLVLAPASDHGGNLAGAGFRIPVNTPYGSSLVTVTGARSGRSATLNLRVVPVPPSVGIAVTPQVVGHDGRVVVTGRGFAGGEVVLIRLRAVLVQAAATDGHGHFRVAFRVPGNRFRGIDALEATGARSGLRARATLVVS
jgi:hypothetical protein